MQVQYIIYLVHHWELLLFSLLEQVWEQFDSDQLYLPTEYTM